MFLKKWYLVLVLSLVTVFSITASCDIFKKNTDSDVNFFNLEQVKITDDVFISGQFLKELVGSKKIAPLKLAYNLPAKKKFNSAWLAQAILINLNPKESSAVLTIKSLLDFDVNKNITGDLFKVRC